jgi:DNA-binding CsgD family transcriptional regulator
MRKTVKERDDLIVEMVKNGKSYRETGRIFGISHERVRQIYRKSYPQV